MTYKAERGCSKSVAAYSPFASMPRVRHQHRPLALLVSTSHVCKTHCVCVYVTWCAFSYLYWSNQESWVLCFCFVLSQMPVCMAASAADATATEILNPNSDSFNYLYCYCRALTKERERDREKRRREASKGRERWWRNRGKRRGVVVCPKKGCFKDRICMCTQWQHSLCFSMSCYTLSVSPCFAPFHFFLFHIFSFFSLLLPSPANFYLLYLQISTLCDTVLLSSSSGCWTQDKPSKLTMSTSSKEIWVSAHTVDLEHVITDYT